MMRVFVVAVSLGVCSSVTAQVVPLADVKAKGGVQLSAADLRQLMPGAKVVSVLVSGSTRRWTNKADGTFMGSTDGRSFTGGKTSPASGLGTWRVADNGTYCIDVKWGAMVPENWCRHMFKAGEVYYGASSLAAGATASEFTISK